MTRAPVVGFDLDMTLADSAAGITATFIAAAAQASGGRIQLTRDEVWPFIGLPLPTTAEKVARGIDPAGIVTAYRELYPRIGVPQTTRMPGAVEALTAVRDAGGRILVVSAKRQAALDAVLQQIELAEGHLAPDLVAGDRFAGQKGELLRAQGAHVYVGDHPGDVEAALVGGAAAVAVATGPISAGELAAAGADVVLPDLFAFPAWLQSWMEAFARR